MTAPKTTKIKRPEALTKMGLTGIRVIAEFPTETAIVVVLRPGPGLNVADLRRLQKWIVGAVAYIEQERAPIAGA